MNAIIFNRDLTLENNAIKLKFKKGYVYVISDRMHHALSAALINSGKIIDDIFMTKSLFKIMLPYDASLKFSKVHIFRDGGIGDLLAISSIVEQIKCKDIYLYTQKKYHAAIDWYNRQPSEIRDSWDSIGSYNDVISGNHSYIYYGDAFEQTQMNWYEIMFMISGFKNITELYRPSLLTRIEIKKQCKSNMQIDKFSFKNIIVSHKASAQMRSINPLSIIEAIKELDIKNYLIYFYDNDLSLPEKIILAHIPHTCIIKADSLKQYLMDLYEADFVISADTAAIHFREGIKRPALGIYASFTTNSRTKHYQYTYSIDIKSSCINQPCFTHQKFADQKCDMNINPSSNYAPCLDLDYNDTIVSQIKTALEKYFI